jgi:hypothetical protein
MKQPAGIRPLRGILVGCAALAVVASAQADRVLWLPSASLGPQVTVYVSQPLWARNTAARTYGIRLEQVRSDADFLRRNQFGTVHRKALIDLQLRRHSGLRLEFAARVAWDLERESFGLTSDESSRVIDLAFRIHEPPATLLSGRWARPPSSATVPARFVLYCGVATPQVQALSVRHRTEDPAEACNALALADERPFF